MPQEGGMFQYFNIIISVYTLEILKGKWEIPVLPTL